MNNQNVNNESTVNRLDAKSGWLFNQGKNGPTIGLIGPYKYKLTTCI